MDRKGFDSTKLERILHLYMTIKSAPEKTPGEIREALGIEKSTYGRYRDLLHGIGVEFRFDRKKRRHVIERDAFLTAPDLTFDERLAIILAVGRLGGMQETYLGSRARQAAAKLIAVNEPAIATACSALLEGRDMPVQVGGKATVVETLFRAITERRRVALDYHKPHADPEEFEMDPYQLYVREGALYLDGFHWDRRAVRCLKVCRIHSAQITEIGFSSTRDYDYDERRQNAFCLFATEREPEMVRIRFSPFAAPFIREEYRNPTQQVTDHDDGSLTYEVRAGEPREVLWWAMRWGADFEVLEPEWLREEAMRKVRGMMGVYGMGVEK